MRDTQKMKDKLELSLDGRHLFTLAAVSLVALGAVFWLGIAVGKKLQREEAVAPQPDLLAALDADAQRADSGPLTFQEELTRKAPVLVVDKPVVQRPAPVERVVEKLDPPPRPAEKPLEKPAEPVAERVDKVLEKPAEPPADKALAAAKPAPPAEAPGPAPAEPKGAGERYVERVPAMPVVELPVEKPAEKPAPPPAGAQALVNTRTGGDAGALRDAIARASRPAQASADGSWTLQLSAYQDRAEADRYLAGLRDRGYAPYVVEAKIPNKGTWYRVRMGRFPTREAASHYLADFQRETQIPAIVTSVQ